MNTRTLGAFGPELSVVGLGAWAMGGGGWFASWGPQDDDASIRTIHRALDEGITWIDTAPIYGLGHSEEVVGAAIRGRRDEVFVATKCTNRWHEDRTVYRSGVASSVREECEQSLRRLGVDHVDLLQIHRPPEDVPIEETWSELARLAEEGKTRFVGLSNCDVDQHRRCMAIRHVDSTQPHYNLLLRRIEDELLDYCRENGVGVIPFGPMYEGLLSGAFDPARLAAEDFRKGPDWAPRIEQAANAVERLGPVAARFGVTIGQLAISWVIANPIVTSAIVGARTPEQVALNVVPGRNDIDPALRDTIDAAVADLIETPV